jgi:hypothetical protein
MSRPTGNGSPRIVHREHGLGLVSSPIDGQFEPRRSLPGQKRTPDILG